MTGGCAENRSSLFIAYALVATSSEDGCTLEVSDDATAITKGTMDLSQTEQYTTALVFGNQLTPRADQRLLRTETSRIQLEGAEVTVSALDGGSVNGGSYSVPFSMIVNPDTDGIGLGAAFVTLVPPGIITETGEYFLELSVYGRTTGGTPIESGLWSFPLTACRNCLAACPSDPTDEAFIEPPCAGLRGSDYSLDCRKYYPGCSCAAP